MKLSDYIVKRLVDYKVKHVFMISGGGAMHLNDSVGKCKDMEYSCHHHEQACAIAAEGYSRILNKLAVVIVTTGPGGTNTITGLIGQWLDSVPVLYISGQVKFETTIESCKEIGLRQLGDQEINIIDIVRPITKYVAMVKDPKEIKRQLDKSIYIATHGRPGPVWLDIPLNVQGANIEEKELIEYDSNEDMIAFDQTSQAANITRVMDLIEKSKRPIILAGQGIRISGALETFRSVINKLKIPVVSSLNGFDLLPSDHPLSIGRIGTIGDRAGNYAIQNSDLVLCIGSRNNIRQISYNWGAFARKAIKIVVDIDRAELEKPTIKPDIPIQMDAKDFLEDIHSQIKNLKLPDFKKWLDWCIERKKKYPVVLPEHEQEKKFVNPYYFMKKLSEIVGPGQIIVAGNATATVTYFQAGKVKKGQRVVWNSGCASMGYDLPASIGACFAASKDNVICLAGDGSLQMNIQELQTLVHHKLPVKIFYLNNSGYISIIQTQDNFFEGRHTGCDKRSGVTFPNIIKVAKAYGLKTERILNHRNLEEKIVKVLHSKGPLLCEVLLPPNYIFSPKVASERKSDGRIVSKPLEDMFPFLDRKEFKNNMLIPEWNP